MEPDDPEEPSGGLPHRAGADGSDEVGFQSPPPLDDRLWRHPSELHTGPELDTEPWCSPPAGLGGRRALRSGTGRGTALVSGVVGSLIAIGAIGLTGRLAPEAPRPQIVVRETVAPTIALTAVGSRAAGGGPVVAVAEGSSPAIVRIDVEGDLDGSGSGVILRDDGHVLTNAHVVDDAERIMVVLSDGTPLRAELVGVDEITDIAVVKVERAAPFTTALLGSAAALVVGQPTVAIGSPLGLLGGSSVTTGVVSALGREVDSRDGPPLLDMIQTDAAIAPGSSGGALLDMRGAVIGITTAIAVSQVGAEGLGFAVPIDLAVRIAGQIIEQGRAVHVWLGIEGRDLSVAAAADAGLKGGAEVTDVMARGPAANGALEAGDVIVDIGGDPVVSMSSLVVALRQQAPGDGVTLQVLHDGAVLERQVTLEERPPS